MKHRRAPHEVAAARAWDRFVAANAPVVAASGIPSAYVASIDHFDDFLTHGFLAHHLDDTGFRIESMSEERSARLVMLVESYFVAGYEWFPPAALRRADQRHLASRFGAPGAGRAARQPVAAGGAPRGPSLSRGAEPTPSARAKGEAPMESCRIGSARLAYRVFGDEPVSVVIEAALNSCSAEWWDFCERLPGVSTLVYDRAGYGTSSPSSLPRTPENVVRELEELLERVGSAERITLIGHSQGGLYAALFALRNPKKVKGVVLLDPLSFTDNDFRSRLTKDEFRASGVDKTSALRVGGLVTRFGLGFLFRSMLKKAPPFYYHRYRKDAEDYILSSLTKHEHYRTAIAEYSLAHQDGHLEAFRNRQNSLAIPFVVIVHSSEKMMQEIEYYGHTSSHLASKIESVWQEVMRAMAQFSSESRIVVAENSSHYIHLTDGEMVAGIVGGIA